MNTLFDLYCSNLQGLKSFHSDLGTLENYDGPFLMCEPPSIYKNSNKRLLIIGQETNGWSGDLVVNSMDTIRRNVELYSEFNFGENYNSLFFQYARRIALKITGEDFFMWSNLNKFGKGTDSIGRPSQNVTSAETVHFNILVDEIRVVDPTCIVFLTGPKYDDLLVDRLRGARLEEIDGFGLRQFARVIAPGIELPIFRMYHPGYGNRISEKYAECINYISQECGSNC